MTTCSLRLCLCLAVFATAASSPALATSGPGCLVVVNVAADDTLNVRSAPSASAAIVDQLIPGRHGIVHLDAPCAPLSVDWGSRWCSITHYSGDKVSHGFVKARFVRDSECP